MKLPEIHPSLYSEFRKGNVFVGRIPETFNKLPPDQVIEQTINKDHKGFCVIKGLSTTEGALQQSMFSSNFVSSINANRPNKFFSMR